MVLKRLILGLNGTFALVNGGFMLVASEVWFASVAASTGPFNLHLVKDVGAAFVISGLALFACLWRPAFWPAALVGAAFLSAHGLIHLANMIEGHAHHPVRDLFVLIIPALLSLWAAWPSQGQTGRAVMFRFIARRMIVKFGNHYGYDVAFMLHMLETTPDVMNAFNALSTLADYRRCVPVPAFMAAKLVGTLHEDCGPCAQLAVDMTREAGVAADQIEAVLTGNEAAMSADTALGYRFATAIVARSDDADAARDAVRSAYGDAGVIELTLAAQVTRIYPMIKSGLGYGRSCSRVALGEREIVVVNAAA